METFLHSATSVAEHQPGPNYVTMSATSRIFDKFEESCKKCNEEEGVLPKIAQSMLSQLQHYSRLVETEPSRFVRISDQRFRMNTPMTGDILRSFQTLRQPEKSVEVVDCETRMRTIMNKILDENSLDMVVDDEIVKVFRATTNLDHGACPLKWWKENSQRFSHIAAAARRYMAMQSSSAARESVFSVSGNLVDAERTRLPDGLLLHICASGHERACWTHLRSRMERQYSYNHVHV